MPRGPGQAGCLPVNPPPPPLRALGRVILHLPEESRVCGPNNSSGVPCCTSLSYLAENLYRISTSQYLLADHLTSNRKEQSMREPPHHDKIVSHEGSERIDLNYPILTYSDLM